MPTTDSLAATISNIEVQVAADHNGAIIAAVRIDETLAERLAASRDEDR